jgi:hypothetical protein
VNRYIQSDRNRISRRSVLRGAGKVAICLPLLEAMACDTRPGTSLSAGTTARGGAPRRLILFFIPNGTIPPAWFPDPGASETDFTLKPLMAPLAPFREQMLILSGVDNQVYLKGLIDNHNEGMSTLLTGLPAGDLTLPVEMRTTYQANGISLDQHVAAAIGGGTVMPSLPIGFEWYNWLYDKNRNQIQHQGSPSQLFMQLFGDPNIDPEALNKLVARRKSILDDVAGDFESLIPKVSSADRTKLEEHLEAIRALEMGLGNTTSCKPDMPMYPGGLSPAPGRPRGQARHPPVVRTYDRAHGPRPRLRRHPRQLLLHPPRRRRPVLLPLARHGHHPRGAEPPDHRAPRHVALVADPALPLR